jgi:hypothetical protein
MDLLKLIKSIEELLYEVVTWMYFYPRTLWRSVRHPFLVAGETKAQFAKPREERFAATLGPPLFLLLSILVAHAMGLGLRQHLDEYKSLLAKKLFESDANLLIFRAITYSLFPLLLAVAMLRRQGASIDQNTLREPFFVQCSFAAPMVIFTSISVLLTTFDNEFVKFAGVASWLASVIWFLAIESMWVRMQLQIGRGRALLAVTKPFLLAMTLSALAALAIVGPEVVAAFQDTSSPP